VRQVEPGGSDLAHEALARYRERLERNWGGGTLAAAARGGRLPGGSPEAWLYAAEVAAALLEPRPGPELRAALPSLGSLPELSGWADAPGSAVAALLTAARALGEGPVDPFVDRAQVRLGQALPRPLRRALGIHFTPPWLARAMVERVLGEAPAAHVIDPSCGTGVMLLEVWRARWEAAGRPAGGAAAAATARGLVGLEASPLLAAVAQLALCRTARALGLPDAQAPRVHCADALGAVVLGPGDRPRLDLDPPVDLPRFELVLGNPPWVAWDHLPRPYKDKLARGWLATVSAFEVSGFSAGLGAANDDVSALVTLLAVDRLAAPDGRLALVLKWNLLTNETARSLRRFAVVRRAGPPVDFAVELAWDLRRANPFDASVEPAVLFLRRDRPMGDRLPCERWARAGRAPVITATTALAATSPGGPWAPADALRATADLAGENAYAIRHGVKHDCNGVFLVEPLPGPAPDLVQVRNRPETSRRIAVPPWSGPVERQVVHPLIQSRHLGPLGLRGWAHALLPVSPEGLLAEPTLAALAPLAHAYLAAHRSYLAERRSRVFAAAPFYRVFGVGPYAWAPCLVVWCGMSLRPDFAVVDRVDDPLLGPVRPLVDSACYLIATGSADEAWFVAGLLHSRAAQQFLRGRSSGSKRGLGQAVMRRLALPRYAAEQPVHRALSAAAAGLAGRGLAAAEIADALEPFSAPVWDILRHH
jgi:hypothetical protein